MQDMSRCCVVFRVHWEEFVDAELLWNRHILPELQRSREPRIVPVEPMHR